ncbi:MAG TPA: RNA polymerase sigma factor [Polyangiaceae bacterium]
MTALPSDFTTAYTRLLPPIRAKCRRLLGSSPAAEDVAQEAFLRLWKSGISGDPRTVVAWLYRTCTRLAIDVLRDRRRVDLGDVSQEDAPCAVDLAACAEARAAIAELAGAVPEEQLAVVVLVRVDGLSHAEAATVLGVNERTVRRLLARFDEGTSALRQETSS